MKANFIRYEERETIIITGQYLPMLKSFTNAIPLPQPLNDMNVSLTWLSFSIEKWAVYNAGSLETLSAKKSRDLINL